MSLDELDEGALARICDPEYDLLKCRDALRCAACGSAITREAFRIEVQGSHEHRRSNPHGHRFRIGCFGEAAGCAAAGEPTAQWSWFAGYAWQIASCRACGEHLGWRFGTEQASGGAASVFYGLILARLHAEH